MIQTLSGDLLPTFKIHHILVVQEKVDLACVSAQLFFQNVQGSVREQPSTGQKEALGSKVVMEAHKVLTVAGSKNVVELDAVLDIGMAAPVSKVTVVDPPGLMEQIHGRQTNSSKDSPAVFGCSML